MLNIKWLYYKCRAIAMAGKEGGAMRWLICYDIQNARNRRNVLKILRSGSLGYQKSGFEHGLDSSPQAVLFDLSKWLTEQDRLLVLPRSQSAPTWHLGQGVCSTDNHCVLFN